MNDHIELIKTNRLLLCKYLWNITKNSGIAIKYIYKNKKRNG